MTAKNTPGPWIKVGRQIRAKLPEETTGHTVCIADMIYGEDAEAEANALLGAQAPAFLRASRLLLETANADIFVDLKICPEMEDGYRRFVAALHELTMVILAATEGEA